MQVVAAAAPAPRPDDAAAPVQPTLAKEPLAEPPLAEPPLAEPPLAEPVPDALEELLMLQPDGAPIRGDLVPHHLMDRLRHMVGRLR